MNIAGLIGRLDVFPGNKMLVGAVGLVATAALHMTASIVVAVALPGNEQLTGAIDGIAEKGYEGFGVLTGVGIAFKAIRADAATRGIVPALLAVVGLSWFTTGCASKPVTVQACMDKVQLAEAAKIGCTQFTSADAQRQCIAIADAAIATARAGCQFADQEVQP